MSDLVGNPEDRFSRVAAQIKDTTVFPFVVGHYLTIVNPLHASKHPGDTARLTLLTSYYTFYSFNVTCISFWYNMNGSFVGALSVLVKDYCKYYPLIRHIFISQICVVLYKRHKKDSCVSTNPIDSVSTRRVHCYG